jgi:cation diffusion facilitator CzcD-associated flavoprotein CzcO
MPTTDALEPVLIIGAGAAGLATAAELQRRGVQARILERSDTIGAAWRTRYDCLRLNTCKWYSTLSQEPYPKGTPVFPRRDDYIRYLESYAERHELSVQFGVHVSRIDSDERGWRLSAPAGELIARHVIIATGYKSMPWQPDWPELDRYPGRLLHSADYRDPGPFRDRDVLVVGAGSSATDIASDLAYGGAGRVRVAVRTQPNLMRRAPLSVPADLIAAAAFRLPPLTADRADRLLRRITIGDLAARGLTVPDEGSYTRTRRTGSSPTVVSKRFLKALRSGRIEIVAGVASVDANGVLLADGSAVHPDVIVAATGFTSGLAGLAGHLGVLDDHGLPLASGGPAALPGLRFTGFVANIRSQYKDALHVAEQVALEQSSEHDAVLPPVAAGLPPVAAAGQ